MTVNYTTNLDLAQPVTGTEDGTWGDDVNNGLTSYLDISIAGGLAISVTTTDVTLTNTQGTSSGTNIGSTTAQYAILNISGAKTGNRNLVVPSSSKWYIVNNAGTSTVGPYTLTIKGSATTGVSLSDGEKALIAWNGSDYVKITTLPNYTTSYVPYGNGTGSFSTSANFQFDGTVLRVGSNALLGGTTNPIAGFTGGTNNYIQTYVYNATNGASSSADFVAYGYNSTDSHGWADLGYTSLAYADSIYTCTGPGEAYLFGSGLNSSYTGNLVYATDSTGSANAHQWYVGGFTQVKSAYKMQLTSTTLDINVTIKPVGSTSTFAAVFPNIAETTTVSATAATGTINYYVNSQSVLIYTSNAAANWTLNVAFSSGTALNTALATGQTVTIAFMVQQGSTAYYPTGFTIDGTPVTPKWQGGTAPTAGSASSLDTYTYSITKTGSAAYIVLASQTKFA
jgi:hypothetical protein